MTVTLGIKFEDGKAWGVQSGTLLQEGPSVIVPISQLIGLSSEEIGNRVKDLVEKAQMVELIERAEYLSYQRIGPYDDSVVRFLDAAEPYRYKNEALSREILYWESRQRELDQKIDVRKTTQKQDRKRRKYISKNYNDIFVRIGRRDGFLCQQCHSSNNLSIDHIKPLVSGGSNDDSNLQILCVSCNSRKSDSV